MSAAINILIIDDEPYIRFTMSMILKRAGYNAAVAANAREGFRQLKSQNFQLVLLDVHMPGVSGMQLLPEIRRHFPDLPVIILTGYGSSEIQESALRLGVGGFLQKPMEPSIILNRIKDTLLNQPPLIKKDLINNLRLVDLP